MRSLALLACLAGQLLLGGCSGSPGKQGDEPVGRIVSYTPPPDPDPSAVPGPKTAAGALILASAPQFQLTWSPPAPGPVTALAQCSRWISGCVSPERHLDDCARSVPTCATAEPWNEPACCPAACYQRYAAARRQGTKDKQAFTAAYFDRADSCIPGLSALLKASP